MLTEQNFPSNEVARTLSPEKDTGNMKSNEIPYYHAQFLGIFPRLQNAQH